MRGALEGIRVLEVASFISGPYAAMLLADLGADVIKVEQPGAGDPFRGWAVDEGRIRPTFSAYNRGKRGITLDLHTDAGREIFVRLAATADVVIENFRPGTTDRLGVGYDVLRASNERLVYCSISGMGSTGPEKDRPTYDAVAQAMSGLWSTLTDMQKPEPVGPPIADQLTGLYAAYGILGALVQRERCGLGQRVELSMLSANVAFMTVPVAHFLADGEVSTRSTRPHQSQSYAFVAMDDLPFAIHLSSPPKFWIGLLKVVGMPELATDPRFSTKGARVRNYLLLHDVLAAIFVTRSRGEWLVRLQAEDVPCAPINHIGETLSDPQVLHLGMVRTFGEGDRAQRLVGFPVTYGTTPSSPGLPPPQVGEHNEEILATLGCTDEEISRLLNEGAI